ncbi:MAG: FAD-dependent oxidoreductase [Lachnospiraceae bacterium]|nr:FAD-dependent oxidoreductase [Lachnospiraceae bacterium]
MVKKYRINIDGKEVTALPGQTILEAAGENDIYIPTLCYDERMDVYGACGLCVVEAEGNPKLLKACATEVAPGMVIRTNSPRIEESRKINLELLLSNHVGDCRPPCVKACPAQTDCQGYVGLIAEGRYQEALELIKDRIPLPASIGRVCPHPCEAECRRGLVEEPVSIAALKRFAGDLGLADGDFPAACAESGTGGIGGRCAAGCQSENSGADDRSAVNFQPACAEPSGKRVAVIGGGPYGLSMAYFLRRKGHAVTIFEAMPYAGGMLRYGIPEYRLPKTILEEEVGLIRGMGVEIRTGVRVGEDVSFDSIRKAYDAVCIGIGAWKSTGVRCEGEDTPGVIGGIDFLRRIERNEPFEMGKRVAVVGGGNTAMDACRSAVRLGAEKVYNIYRRTIDEMPADRMEIEEAVEEGVILKNLRNPLRIHAGEDGRVASVTLQVMELGEPDASGRRSPRPVEGRTEDLDVDMVILAIGQAVDPTGITGVEFTKKNGIVYDPHTFMTGIPGVFAGGDCGNDKISIAVESIADARKGSETVDSYLEGKMVAYRPEYTVARTDITEKTFEDRERQCRPETWQLSPEERKGNFLEVAGGLTKEQARSEASRCLECGCHDYFECKLAAYANQYDVKPERIAGEIKRTEFQDPHPFIEREPYKCILCGLCVRACEEVMGVGAIGFVDRGFDTVVLPALGRSLKEAGCISCGQCVSVCPTGALQERLPMTKQIPLETKETDTICGFCSMGCAQKIMTRGSLAVKALPDPEGPVNAGILCVNGKFGFSAACREEDRILTPLVRASGNGRPRAAGYHDALILTAKSMQSAVRRYGSDAVAVAVSDRFTTEEAYAAKELAERMGARIFSFDNRACGLESVLGLNASPNTLDELMSTEVILAVGFDAAASQVMRVKLMNAAKAGAAVVLINPAGYEQEYMEFTARTIYTENNLGFLKQIAKVLAGGDEASAQGRPGAASGQSAPGQNASVQSVSGQSSSVRNAPIQSASGQNTSGQNASGAGSALAEHAGYEAFLASLADVKVSDEAAEVAALYREAKKAMIVFQQHIVSVSCAELLAEIALLSGHIGSPRDGIVMLRPKNNSQGLAQLGITAGPECMDGVKALLVLGENPDPALVKDVEFLAVCDTHLTPLAREADAILPGTAPIHAEGSYLNTERRFQATHAALEPETGFKNRQLLCELAEILEIPFPYNTEEDIEREMSDRLSWYREASEGEIIGGVLRPEKKQFAAVRPDVFVNPSVNTDYLMHIHRAGGD